MASNSPISKPNCPETVDDPATTTPTILPLTSTTILPRSLPIPIPVKDYLRRPTPYCKRGYEVKEEPETPEEEREYFRQIQIAAAEAAQKKAAEDKAKVNKAIKSLAEPLKEIESSDGLEELHLDFGVRLKNLFKKLVPKSKMGNTGVSLDKGEDAVEWQGKVEEPETEERSTNIDKTERSMATTATLEDDN